jgi:hypothetical protein
MLDGEIQMNRYKQFIWNDSVGCHLHKYDKKKNTIVIYTLYDVFYKLLEQERDKTLAPSSQRERLEDLTTLSCNSGAFLLVDSK